LKKESKNEYCTLSYFPWAFSAAKQEIEKRKITEKVEERIKPLCKPLHR